MSLDLASSEKARPVKELLRTTDIVLITYVKALLDDAGICAMVADVHISSVEGSIGAFPRRVLVAAEDWHESVSLLSEAGLGDHLAAPKQSRVASRI
jgi:hypothetical protein